MMVPPGEEQAISIITVDSFILIERWRDPCQVEGAEEHPHQHCGKKEEFCRMGRKSPAPSRDGSFDSWTSGGLVHRR